MAAEEVIEVRVLPGFQVVVGGVTQAYLADSYVIMLGLSRGRAREWGGRLFLFGGRDDRQRNTVPGLWVMTCSALDGCVLGLGVTAASEGSFWPGGPASGLRSDLCRWEDLLAPHRQERADSRGLDLGEGWSRRWTARWRFGGEPVICPARDLASMPVQGAQPVRRFSWRTSQRHRPGLQYMVSTGRHHGFESYAEQQLLVALDFAGEVLELLGQPFRLSFTTACGTGEHIPDFLAVTRDGTWLIDVRPAGRIAEKDAVRFAAAAEVALSCGWRYTVATGWLPNVWTTLDTLSSRRKPTSDPLGLGQVLLAQASRGPVPFGDLVEGTEVPAAARAQALHLLWRRRLGIDLATPLGDHTLVHLAADAGSVAGKGW